jgi:hypothetical protein
MTQFIETMESLHVQGPKSNVKAVRDYLRADGPFQGQMTVLTRSGTLEKDMDFSYT